MNSGSLTSVINKLLIYKLYIYIYIYIYIEFFLYQLDPEVKRPERRRTSSPGDFKKETICGIHPILFR